MKKLLLLSFALLFSATTLFAQDKKVEDSNYVILLNEKVFHYTFDGVVELKSDLKLNNGAVVKADGTYMVDGKSMTLKDGECLGMSGKKYKDQATLAKKLQKQLKKG